MANHVQNIARTVVPHGVAANHGLSIGSSEAAAFEPKKVLFTGGAGFIGSNVLCYMVRTYPEVFFLCLDNLSEGSSLSNLDSLKSMPNFSFVLGTITSEATLRSLMEKHQFDTVMHFAAQTHVDRSFVRPTAFCETNVMGTAVLLKASKDFGIKRFFHVSTDEVYGENVGSAAPFTEEAHLKPGNPCSASKAGAECLVKGYTSSFGKDLSIVTVRPSNIYGPRQYPEKLIPKFALRLLRKQQLPLHGGGAARRSFLFVEDAARAFDLVLRRGRSGEVYNIGAREGSTKSVLEVAMAVQQAMGIDSAKAREENLEIVPDRAKNDGSYDIDSSKVKALGWQPVVTFEKGLEITVSWYQNNPLYWGNVDKALLPHNMGEAVTSQVLEETTQGKVWYAPYKFQAYGEEEIQEVVQCLRDGWLAPGPRTEEFEKRVSELFGKRYGLMVNSGSSANLIGLAVLGLSPGDEVITPACTFSTVVAPLEQLRLKPVFVDVLAGSYVPTVDAVMEAVTERTKCIFLPNLVGSKPDWPELRRRIALLGRNIVLFEDSCDCITYTPESDLSVISFYASHIITAGGLGGCVMFNDAKLRDKALMFRDWGRIGNNTEDVNDRFAHNVDGIEYDFKFLYGCVGYNMKACEMNAAFGLAQLRKLNHFRALRRRNICRYVETLREANTTFVLPAKYEEQDWLALPLMHKDRKGLLRYLEANDVQIRVCFAGNITRHPAYRHYLGDFPESDRIMAEGFLIGAHHGLTTSDVDRVCELLIKYDRGLVETQEMTEKRGTGRVVEEGGDAATLDF